MMLSIHVHTYALCFDIMHNTDNCLVPVINKINFYFATDPQLDLTRADSREEKINDYFFYFAMSLLIDTLFMIF